MIEANESQESDKFQLVTFNGNTIVGVGDVSVFSGTEKLQLLTLGEAQAQGWSLDLGSELSEGQFLPNTLSVNPPIIEEENSSDNLPAIGHLEGFEIQTADDGTLLPSTVNAKMADGSYQRLTLFPQVVDGNVTCMVHFENEVAQIEELSKTASLSEKIDSIICQNEDIVSNSKKLKSIKRPKEAPVSLLKSSQSRQAIIPNVRKISPLKGHISKNNALYFPIKEAIDPAYHRVKLKEKPYAFPSAPQRLQTSYKQPSQPSRLKSVEAEISGPTEIPLAKEPISIEKVNHHPSPASTNDVAEESSEIFIKTSPEFFSAKEKSDHPLGSSENPITLLQTGQVYHSQQPLSETQLRQISSILKTQRNNLSASVGKNYLIDPKTKTRIVYRVVYPDENKPMENKPKRGVKRGRSKAIIKETNGIEEEPVLAEDNSPGSPQASPSPKVMKLPRTRSGRLSRPPRYMVQDYKRLQTNAEVPLKTAEADLYVDYRSAEEVPSPAVDNTSLYFNHRLKKKKNFKSEYRCPTCQKIYLGHAKMMLHLRKFPDHSNMDEYLEIYERARTERKVRPLNVSKLKQILTGVDKTAYGPLLANAFTLWDFLLLRVNILHQTGIEETEALLKELSLLLEKLGKIAEELLSPVFNEEEESDVNYVHLNKHELAYALGLPQGTYKVNTDRLHLLRLAKEEPPPPPPPLPKPTILSTKFEPNLSTKLLDCSNDSIDLDCSSKDVEPEDDKKEWSTADKADDTNSEFLSEFLQNQLPSREEEGLALWKTNNEVAPVSPVHVLPAPPNDGISLWKEGKAGTAPGEELQLWQDNTGNAWKSNENCPPDNADLWKPTDPAERNAVASWSETAETERDVWKNGNPTGDTVWPKEDATEDIWKNRVVESGCSPTVNKTSTEDAWQDKSNNLPKAGENDGTEGSGIWHKPVKPDEEVWEAGGGEKESKKDWLRQAGMPGMRTTRLTSTPETHGTHGTSELFSPPLRRNSVSSFAPSHQEELLSLDLHELFEELMPEQNKPRRPKPSSIESIINEALFTGNEPPAPHPSLPPSLIPDALDEVTNLDFLSQD